MLFTPGKVLPEPGDWFGKINADKLIHVGIFAVLAFLVMIGLRVSKNKVQLPRVTYTKVAFGIAAWGVATELIQGYVIPNRSMSFMDGFADALGAVVGVIIFRKYYYRKISATAL